MGEPARKLDDDESLPQRPNLGVVSGGGEGDGRPAGQLKEVPLSKGDGVYDPDSPTPVTKPNLRVLEGGNENDADKTLTPRDLNDEESSGAKQTSSKAERSEREQLTGGSEKPEGDWKVNVDDDDLTRLDKFRGKFTRKRTAIGVSIFVVLFGGGGILSVIQGPLHLLTLGNVLSLPFSNQDNASENRLGAMFRFARSGDFGETRVSWLGSRSVKKTYDRLEKVGYKIEDRTAVSRYKKASIDLDKFSPGENTAQAADRIARENNIPREYITYDPVFEKVPGGKLIISNPDGGVIPNKIARAMDRTGLNRVYGKGTLGQINTAYKMRPLTKFNAYYRPWHVIKKLNVKTAETLPEWLKSREEAKAKRSAKVQERVNALKEKFGGKIVKGAGIAGGGQLAICLAKEAASSVPLTAFENVQIPSRNEAIEYASVASQLAAGDDFDPEQLGAIEQGMADQSGQTFWSGKALDAMANNNKGTGVDIEPDIKSGYRSNSFAADVEKTLDAFGGDYICSPTGQIAGLTVGLAAVALAAPTGGLSLVAGYGATVAASAAVTTVAVTAATDLLHRIVDQGPLTEKVVGAYGGNLVAYGARDLANANYRSNGGVALPDSNKQILTASVQAEMARDYASKSLKDKLFDVHDYRSVTSKLIMKSSPDPTTNIENVAKASFNVTGLVSSFFGAFSGKASAQSTATEEYDWGFPIYGFTDEELSNPAVEDPYKNADDAVGLITSNSSYKDRAEKCFGVQFNQDDSGLYQVKYINVPEGEPERAVIPSSAAYDEANCGEKSVDWLKIRMYIFDSRTMEAYACMETSETDPAEKGICADFDATPPKDTATLNVGAAGDADLTLLAGDTDNVPCFPGTKDLGVVQTNFTLKLIVPSGKAPKVRLCQIPTIPGQGNNTQGVEINGGAVVISPLSQAWYNLGKDAQADGVNLVSSSSFRLADSCGGTGTGSNGCASPGNSPHQSGAAIDFENMGGFDPKGDPSSCTGRMTYNSPEWKWMKDNAEKYGIYQFSQESWHWDPFYPVGNRCDSKGTATGAVSAVSTNSVGDTIGGSVTLKQLSPYLNSPGGTITPKGITLHWWGSNGNGISSLVTALRGNTSCPGGCSVQIGITKEGDVYQMTKNLNDLTYHATGGNTTTIGIEIEGGPADFGQAGIAKYPQKFEAVVATVKFLMQKYNIPADGSPTCNNVIGVHPHKAYNNCPRAQHKDDIDDYYFNEVMKRVR